MCNVKRTYDLYIYIYKYIYLYTNIQVERVSKCVDAVIAQCGGDGGGGRLINRDQQRFRTIS